jgi:hypothetical protein
MQKRRLFFSILVLSICLNAPGALRADSGISQGFEAGIPVTWTFVGPPTLNGVSPAITNLAPTEGLQFAWISTGCVPHPGTCPDVGTLGATYPSPGDGVAGSNGLPALQALGAPTVETTLTSSAFSVGSGDIISFDVNFVTTDGTYDFADFAFVQLVPTSAPAINLFVANTTCDVCTAVPALGLASGVATLSPSTISFSGFPVTFGSIAYGPSKFGGGNGGPTGWIHVSYPVATAGSYQLKFVVAHVGDTAFPSALAIDNLQTSIVTTPPQPVATGTSNTFTSVAINHTIQIPPDANLNGAATMQVTFVQIPPATFNSTRLPATLPSNTFSGGNPVPAGTTCTPLQSAGGNCIVIQTRCFNASNAPIDPCPITATPADPIQLNYHYVPMFTQTHPGLLLADDNQNNWTEDTTGANTDCCTLNGKTNGTNMDGTIVDLPGAPASDSTPPVTTAVVFPPANGAGWNNTSPVGVTLISTDPQLVNHIVYSASGAQTIGSTQVNASSTPLFLITPQGQTTVNFQATDNDTPTPSVEALKSLTVKIDTTLPNITITTPPPGTPAYALNQPVASSFLCTDALSGIASCLTTPGGAISGSNVDTTSGGAKTFAVKAVDVAGNTATQSVNYTVVPYNAFVQQPINPDASSVFNASRGVVPVKFSLTQNNAATCALPAATIALTRTAGAAPGAIDESVYTQSADNGSNFRISGCQYIYNLGTKTLGVGAYRVDIIISGAVVANGFFALK